MSEKKTAIIVDLDGTLSDSSHRQHFVKTKPKDFKSFYGGICDDPPNEWCRQLVYSMAKKFEIIFVSGRPEEYRAVTVNWLARNLGEHFSKNTPLFMRKTGDYRQDFVIKEEIYREHIEQNYDILFCVDDRKQVIDMWRRIGLSCLDCSGEDF